MDVRTLDSLFLSELFGLFSPIAWIIQPFLTTPQVRCTEVDNVPPAVWAYEVSGKQVLTQWFSYRKRNRERPIIGDRRPPSKLGEIQPEGWIAEYTTELLNVVHVLGRLVELEEAQAELLGKICSGPAISADELRVAEALTVPDAWRKKLAGDSDGSASLFSSEEHLEEE